MFHHDIIIIGHGKQIGYAQKRKLYVIIEINIAVKISVDQTRNIFLVFFNTIFTSTKCLKSRATIVIKVC